jgi:hypothetical protein
MTPEQVETLLQELTTPEPPPRLRDRVVGRNATPRSAPWTMAAGFAIFALVVWAVARAPMTGTDRTPAMPQDEAQRLVERLGHEEFSEREKATARLIELGEAAEAALRGALRHKDPEIAAQAEDIAGIVARAKRFGRFSKDRAVQAKLDQLLRDHPGKAVLMTRLFERRDETLKPVTSEDFSMKLYVDDEEAGGESAEIKCEPVAPDGFLFFVAPGKGRCSGYHWSPPRALRNAFLLWEYPREYDVSEVLMLSDMRLVPRMEWTAPAPDASLSLRQNPDFLWREYPGVARVRIEMEYSEPMKESSAGRRFVPVGQLEVDCTKERRAPLADVVKASRRELKAGDVLHLTIVGYGAAGQRVSASPPRRFQLEE